jgi:hypothetical protein
MTHKGSCHCGRIAFEVEGEIEQLMECNCSHCSRKGYLLWFAPREKLRLLTPEGDLATYTLNKHVIKHHFSAPGAAARRSGSAWISPGPPRPRSTRAVWKASSRPRSKS